MSSFSKLQKLMFGLTAATTVTVGYYFTEKFNVASFTADYKPSPYAKWDDNWDQRSPLHIKSKKQTDQDDNNRSGKKRSKGCRNLILIRHGQYNTDGLTDIEKTLTNLGQIQAKYTALRLKELGLPYNQIIESTMTRARETRSIISQYLPDIPVTSCELLREGAPIPPEPPLGHYTPESYKYYRDGARIEAAFRKYFYRPDVNQTDDSYTIIVCHANVIRYLVCRALQFPAEAWLRMSLNHASITWISITPNGRCILRSLGDSGHIPLNAVSST